MFDVVIIGGGPAGSAAAVYSARKQLKTCIVAKEFGGQSSVSEEIYNWIGTPRISGTGLAESFKNHVKEYEGDLLTIHEGVYVQNIEKKEDIFATTLSDGSLLESKTVLVATGSSRRKLTIPGADTFENKGVVYCASCDGPLFSGQEVVVMGGGNAGFETAAQLLAYCSKVTLVHKHAEFKADPITVKKVLEHPNMHVITHAEAKEVHGEKFVTGITIHNKDTGEDIMVPAGGIFVEIGQVPATSFAKNVTEQDEYGRILIDPWTQRTNTLGVWSAGDCTNVRYHQNNISAGDAVKAIEDLYLYVKTR
ncbi:MAG: FAD-dependent oxidoreductase [Candidatus Pacebacteria bacterium]|nr:FAD-dependent oxidoreductase [Candidatus Paceibacterota bacterium]